MAFYDDPTFVISHIRNSYVTSDDTGLCEIIIVGEDLPLKHHKMVPPRTRFHDSSDSSGESSALELAQSFDIASDMDLGAHRRRSNTAQRLDRLKKERQSQALIKHVQWKENTDAPSAEELANLFQRKELVHEPPGDKKFRSLLSEQLSELPALPNNPFSEFAKFDGKASVGIPTKKINIFLTMLPAAQRAYPLPVAVLATAKVRELVGLICWQYTNERREPKLKDSVHYYALHIAEDDGEVDMDFPSLDSKELISKFGFSVLALVERGNPNSQSNENSITMYIPGEGNSTFSVESPSWTVGDLMEKVVKRKLGNVSNAVGNDYWLERKSEPGVKLHSRAIVASLNCSEFCIVKNSPRINDGKDSWPLNGKAVMEAPLYQSYLVSILSRVRPKTGIHLGISGEKIEIDPVQQKGSAKLIWSRSQKPVSYDIDTIASCDVLEVKGAGKLVFRLTYVTPGHDYKHHDFEADCGAATEIVQKINHILEMRSSVNRRDYLASRERKSQQRRSFSLSNK